MNKNIRQEILSHLNDENNYLYFESWIPLKMPFELKPKDFIQFAKNELKLEDDENLINSLSNIKRAIDCRSEELLYIFGYYKKSKKENWGFPKKTEFLERIGVVAPKILKKINRKRNELEHKFKKPTIEEVEDFYDIANLFLRYTDRYTKKEFEDCVCLGAITDKTDKYEQYPQLFFKLDSKKGKFDCCYKSLERDPLKFSVANNRDEDYIEFLKKWIEAIEK